MSKFILSACRRQAFEGARCWCARRRIWAKLSDPKSGFRYGKPVASADFDENYQPINADYPAGAPSLYTVQGGDTLRSIAQAAWGDASLWYLIADANGLNGTETLIAGQRLSIPNKVTNIHNNATTFKPYDPGEAIGDTLPTLPPEPLPPVHHHGGCGGIGQILLAVVAIAVVVVTYGALTAPATATLSAGTAAAGGLAVPTITFTSAGVLAGGGLATVAAGAVAGVAGVAGSLVSQGLALLWQECDFSR